MRSISLIIGTLLLLLYTYGCTSHVRQSPGKADPSFIKWTAMDIANAIQEVGLEIENIQSGLIVGVHRESDNIVFMMPSFGKKIGGLVSSFNSEDTFKQFKGHYSEMNKEPEPPVWWIFKRENIILMISGKVPEETARHYEKVLNQMTTH